MDEDLCTVWRTHPTQSGLLEMYDEQIHDDLRTLHDEGLHSMRSHDRVERSLHRKTHRSGQDSGAA